jgi:hypothetical protein
LLEFFKPLMPNMPRDRYFSEGRADSAPVVT